MSTHHPKRTTSRPTMIHTLLVLYAISAVWLSRSVVDGSDRYQLLPLFDRMGEPIFMPKGENNIVYKIPRDWLTKRYKSLGPTFLNRFEEEATTLVPVRKIELPDFTIPRKMGKRQQFSYFVPQHRWMAARLTSIFMGMRDLEDLRSAAVYARSILNPSLFAYAFSVALLHREDTAEIDLPSEADIFPAKYLHRSVFWRAREESATVTSPDHRIPIAIPKTANRMEPEHALAYFREDIGVNLHHQHWHLAYPGYGDITLVKKDRRGELFYYMHEQLLARYNFERFSNRMPRVKKLILREPIEEGYYPKLDRSYATIPGRPSNTTLSDVNRTSEQLQFGLQDLERWADRLLKVARRRTYISESGQKVKLTTETGIDVLGSMIEASLLSPNKNLYGDLHNLGHVAIACAHVPDGRHLESLGVMGDVSTAMRDPAFYRWHKFTDNIFQEYKKGLPPYTAQQLHFEGIMITGVEVHTDGAREPDVFETFWQQNDIDMSRGIDYSPRSPVFARTTHLNHRTFQLKINIQNNGSGQREGYVRIFIAPKFDESGSVMQFNHQRHFMVELDKFRVILNHRNNSIQRRSTQSSVTIPYERTFRTLEKKLPAGREDLVDYHFCNCGWPQHLLIPKGTAEGLPAHLFVMVTDFSIDKVEQPLNAKCTQASSYCGIHGHNYPDKRAMGFPFDRRARVGIGNIQNFLTPNMFVKDVSIKFTNRIEAPTRNTTTNILAK